MTTTTTTATTTPSLISNYTGLISDYTEPMSNYTATQILIHPTLSILVEVNHNPTGDLSPPELLHTLRHLAHTPDLAD